MRSFVGYLFLVGCTAVAAAPPASDKAKQPETKCPPEPAMCTQLYMPAKCSVKISEKTFDASGSNSCFARAALVAKICKFKNFQTVLNDIKCVSTSE